MTAKTPSQPLPPQDDWKKMTDLAEKKRAQNRIAQRNYRRNVKRRIEELEQQVATQAELLAFPETTNPWQVGTSSFKTKVSTTKAIRDNRPTLGRQKTLIVPVSSGAGASNIPERYHIANAIDSTLCDYQDQGVVDMQEGRIDGNVEPQAFSAFRSREKVNKHPGFSESQNAYTYGKASSGSSSTLQFPDLDMGGFDSMDLLHASNSSHPSSNYRNQRQGSTISWPNLDDTGSQSSSPPTPGIRAEPPLGASLEERLGYVMKCTRIAGFEDIDSVIMAYYTEKLDEGSACSTAQRFSRKRTLPKFLEKLQRESRSWRSWEAQPYQDEILNSAEGLYLAEMRNFSTRQGDEFLAALSSTSARDWDCVHRKLQDEVPNLWSLVTKLCLEVAHESGSQHQPHGVLMAVSMLLMTSKHPASKISNMLQQIVTDPSS